MWKAEWGVRDGGASEGGAWVRPRGRIGHRGLQNPPYLRLTNWPGIGVLRI